ncbi:MAG: ATPase domain-containing protein [Candidatus Thermoplasmatota archaeon]|nr:ATPase domain-containing protein [Candidatus Thermoplasmatota archaeon]
MYEIDLDRDRMGQRLGGGFPKGSLVLMMGPFGSGKSILCQRFTYGFLKHDHSVTYTSTELTTKGFIEQMGSLDYPVESYIYHRKLLYIPVYPIIGRAADRSGFLTKLLGPRAKALYLNETIVIDSLSSLIGQDLESKKRALDVLSFFKKLAETKNRCVIMTVDPAEMPDEILLTFKAVCDVFLTVETVIAEGGDVLHRLTVNRFLNPERRITGTTMFRVEPHAGTVVEIAEVA